MSNTVPTLSTPRPPNTIQIPSAGNSTRTSTDTAPDAAGSPHPSRSPLPSRSSSRQASVVLSPSTANGPPSASASTPTQPSGPQSTRRTRAALRDYYGLKKPTEGRESPDPSSKDEDSAAEWSSGIVANQELDAPGFDAQAYVDELMGNQGLDALLRAESGLINEIKFLTSERAALVYDNYSKLIAATDTIQRMRSNMAPLAPQTNTLAPAVGHIAGTAQQLVSQAGAHSPRTDRADHGLGIGMGMGMARGEEGAPPQETAEERSKRRRDRDTVRWVLDAPRRIREEGPEAAEWMTVRGLLDGWKGVEGVESLRRECERAVEASAPPAKA